jgi:hypothetical protein
LKANFLVLSPLDNILLASCTPGIAGFVDPVHQLVLKMEHNISDTIPFLSSVEREGATYTIALARRSR